MEGERGGADMPFNSPAKARQLRGLGKIKSRVERVEAERREKREGRRKRGGRERESMCV